uniref:Uncharacterized protein n=1 Tax=Oryza glumipatula TaxID=40148 RepID=A0A0E0APL7_9ORYZ
MCGCGVGGMTACAGVKHEWGLTWRFEGGQGPAIAVDYDQDAGKSLAVLLASSTTTAPVGVISLLGGVVLVFFHIPTNLQTSGGGVTRRVLLRGVAMEKFQCINDC